MLRPDLVQRAVKQIEARMSAIIRIAKNDGKFNKEFYGEARKFLTSYFTDYFAKYYSDLENATFSVYDWSIFHRTGKRFYHTMLESHFRTLKVELKNTVVSQS